MISSAVIIPEEPQPQPRDEAPSPALKRKFSESAFNDRKRQRVKSDTDELNYDDARKSPTPQPATTASTTSPSQSARRLSTLPKPSVAEEKKRSQRLFGGILGVVSQKSTSQTSAHKRRDEIEARARERQQRESEEQEAERKRKREELQSRRRRDQSRWEEECKLLRHKNMRATSCFLRTKAEPRLYYKPWELRPVEEVTIKQQQKDVEDMIRREMGVKTGQSPSAPERSPEHDDEDQIETEGLPNTAATETTPQDHVQPMSVDGPEQTPQTPAHGAVDGAHDHTHEDEQRHRDDDHHHHDEELVEGQEDDVIY